jgi:hypothetical protein
MQPSLIKQRNEVVAEPAHFVVSVQREFFLVTSAKFSIFESALLQFGHMDLILCTLPFAHNSLMDHDNEATFILVLHLFTRSQEQQWNLLDLDQEITKEEFKSIGWLLVLDFVPFLLLNNFVAAPHNCVLGD